MMSFNHNQHNPLIMVTGFLGAGKTTLLNRILNKPEGRRFAVIVHDVGDVNIDEQLIRSTTGDQISLTNGCVCCTLRTDLFDAVSELVKGETIFDGIVVEASGIADPASLVNTVKLLEEAGLACTETLAYLIDASSFDQLDYEEAEHVLDSAALSDLTVLNKIDLATDKQLEQIKDELLIMAPGVTLYQTNNAELPLDLLLSPPINQLKSIQTQQTPRSKFSGQDYQQLTLTNDSTVNRDDFLAFIDAASEICWRIKGFVRFEGEPENNYLLQVVNRRATLSLFQGVTPASNSLVFIGRVDLFDEELLGKGFRNLASAEVHH